MTKLQKSIFIFVCAALGLWCLFAVPQIANAFWAFCMLGQIPGTDRTLAPETVLRLTLGVFALTVLIAFRRKFFGPLLRQPAQFVEEQPESATPKSSRFKPVRPGKPALVAVLPSATPSRRLPRRVWRWLGFGLAWVLYGLILLTEALDLGTRALARVMQLAWMQLRITARRVAELSMRGAGQAWQWAEPYLRQFDRWLNVTLHKSKLVSDMLEVGAACWKMVAAYGRKLNDLLGSRE